MYSLPKATNQLISITHSPSPNECPFKKVTPTSQPTDRPNPPTTLPTQSRSRKTETGKPSACKEPRTHSRMIREKKKGNIEKIQEPKIETTKEASSGIRTHHTSLTQLDEDSPSPKSWSPIVAYLATEPNSHHLERT